MSNDLCIVLDAVLSERNFNWLVFAFNSAYKTFSRYKMSLWKSYF